MKYTAILFSLILSSGNLGLAHEGHNQAPGSIKSMHGGIPKAGKNFNLEMLTTDGKVQFFPMAHKDESIDINKISLKGKSTSPKGKAQELKFSQNEKAFSTEVDFQGSHRANIEIKAEYEGKVDTFKFLVEK